jgi:Na+-translocating ferredoxin:NAD+ oxidoreductase RnfA subunit
MVVYKDHSLAKIFTICVTLPIGVTDIRFTLDGTGPTMTLATITYTWPQFMFDIEGLFASAIKKTVTVDHLKIIAFKLELETIIYRKKTPALWRSLCLFLSKLIRTLLSISCLKGQMA